MYTFVYNVYVVMRIHVYTKGGCFMRNEMHRGHHRDRHHRGEGRKRKEHDAQQGGAKTFRRGRAIAFLESMNVRRASLKKQLETPELQTIQPILVGELKAVETIIDEFVQLFELYEFEEVMTEENDEEASVQDEVDKEEN